jgi:DNA-directed RNA polymerase specialized sigma24 family protein
LGVSVGAVYSNKSRVMARLRRRIEEIESADGHEPGSQAP